LRQDTLEHCYAVSSVQVKVRLSKEKQAALRPANALCSGDAMV